MSVVESSRTINTFFVGVGGISYKISKSRVAIETFSLLTGKLIFCDVNKVKDPISKTAKFLFFSQTTTK